MWPGEQPPAGGQNPQQQPNPYRQPGHQQPGQPGCQQPNPYAQPGYQRTGPYGQQPTAPWNSPTVTAASPPAGGGDGRTKFIAVTTAAAVVVACAVTGAVLLGGEGDSPAPGPTASSASGSATGAPREADTVKPTVADRKVVVNPELGVAFDVPADWKAQSTDWVWWVSEDSDPDEKVLVGMKAPAVLKEQWCRSDDDRDGTQDDKAPAVVGTRGNNSAKSTEAIARTDSANWVYGDCAQPDRKKVTTGAAAPFTTASGLTGSVATSQSSGVGRQGRCDSEGKSTTFAFELPDGDFASWSFSGAKGVKEEVPDSAVRQIMATVRTYEPAQS